MLEHRTVGYFREEQCDLTEFKSLVERDTSAADVPNAADIQKAIPIYDVPAISASLSEPSARQNLLSEWAQCLLTGPGVLVLRACYAKTDVIDEATQAYLDIIEAEKKASGGGADHFAAAGANDRIWNALQKLCESSAETFLNYFAQPAIDAVCEAWLGPNYQMTAQINLVHPGGAAQQAHRDYHLGFQTAEQSAAYPAHVHDLSPVLTLQGGIAHCDMPIESGPTKLLPFSQTYRAGYAAWRRADFREYFEENCVQLPLSKGDVIFFNPALFHAAGENRTADIQRMVNLLQVSSAFGRAMETVNRRKMCKLLYPIAQNSDLSDLEMRAAVASAAEGYSFPTNLDSDPPVGGLAPETQAQLFHRALAENLPPDMFNAALDEIAKKQSAE